MAHISTLSLQDRSRLVKQLNKLRPINTGSYDYNLAERIGNFVGVSGSMHLARGLSNLESQIPLKKPEQIDPNASIDIDKARNRFLADRHRIIQSVHDSFADTQADEQLRVPSAATGVRTETLLTFAPYQRFYSAHQLNMAVAVDETSDLLRRSMAAISDKLFRLAELDRLLQESLEAQTRKQYKVSIKVLERYFKSTLAKSKEPTDANWIHPFLNIMREMLLAELDTRLQPTIGLLEALNEYPK